MQKRTERKKALLDIYGYGCCDNHEYDNSYELEAVVKARIGAALLEKDQKDTASPVSGRGIAPGNVSNDVNRFSNPISASSYPNQSNKFSPGARDGRTAKNIPLKSNAPSQMGGDRSSSANNFNSHHEFFKNQSRFNMNNFINRQSATGKLIFKQAESKVPYWQVIHKNYSILPSDVRKELVSIQIELRRELNNTLNAQYVNLLPAIKAGKKAGIFDKLKAKILTNINGAANHAKHEVDNNNHQGDLSSSDEDQLSYNNLKNYDLDNGSDEFDIEFYFPDPFAGHD